MGNPLEQHYGEQAGVDLRSNPITRPQTFAQDVLNTAYNNSDDLEKRKGSKVVGTGAPAFGTYTYSRINPDTGVVEQSIIGVGSDGFLKKRNTTALAISYSGSAVVVTASFYLDTVANAFKFKIVKDGVTSLDYVCGLGFDEVSTVTVATLVTQINAVSGMTASASGLNTISAALLELKRDYDLKAASLTLNAYYWTSVPMPSTTAPFFTAIVEANNPDYENASFATADQAAYITDGGFVYKYDGVACYRAGLPGFPTDPASTISTGANVNGHMTSGGVYKYLYEYRFADSNGVVIRSAPMIKTVTLGASDNSTSQTLFGLASSTNFPSFGARVTGDQTNSSLGLWTINVLNHNLLPGMYAAIPRYEAAATYVQEVISVTSTTITINKTVTGAFTVKDTYGIAGSLNRIALNQVADGLQDFGTQLYVYRTDANGTTFHLAYFTWFDQLGGSFTMLDYRADSSSNLARTLKLADEYVPQTYFFELPRACKYLATWNNQVVQAGRPYQSTINTILATAIPNKIATTDGFGVAVTANYTEANICAENSYYWSDIEGADYFPQEGLHESAVYTPFADKIAGLAQNKDSFFVFKDRSLALISGDLGNNNIQQEILESDTGLAAHASIQTVQGALIFLDPIKGFQRIVAGQLPRSIGVQINSLVKNNAASGSSKLNLKRAVSGVNRINSQYLCYLPAETTTSGSLAPNSNSIVCMFDYAEVQPGQYRNSWHIWNNLNMQAGIYYINDELFWNSRIYSSYASAMIYLSNKRSRIKDAWDYEDHNQAINWYFFTSWYWQNLASIDKHYLQLLVKSITRTPNNTFTLTCEQYGNFISSGSALTSFDLNFDPSVLTFKNSAKANLSQGKLEAMAIKFKNSQHQTNVSLTGWEIQLAKDYDVELKK